MEHFNGCVICGAELIYFKSLEPRSCFYCKQTSESELECRNAHYVCDHCHALPANDLIEQFCQQSKMQNPLEMAALLMQNPTIKMHGPEHHFLVPAVLLASYYNHTDQSELIAEKLGLARQRAERIPGGSCGFCGSCGAGIGNGIFLSLITDSSPLARSAWGLSNQMTAETLQVIGIHGGPRCCKRVTYQAILTAIGFLAEHMTTHIPLDTDVKCHFSSYNRECLQRECPFFEDSIG
jgi:hypothetical protein